MSVIAKSFILAAFLSLCGCAGTDDKAYFDDYAYDGDYFNDYSDPYVDDEDDWFYDYYYYNDGQYDYEPDPDI